MSHKLQIPRNSNKIRRISQPDKAKIRPRLSHPSDGFTLFIQRSLFLHLSHPFTPIKPYTSPTQNPTSSLSHTSDHHHHGIHHYHGRRRLLLHRNPSTGDTFQLRPHLRPIRLRKEESRPQKSSENLYIRSAVMVSRSQSTGVSGRKSGRRLRIRSVRFR